MEAIRDVWSRLSAGKAFLVAVSLVAIYQAYCKVRTRWLLRQRIRGKVVLITGASSGLGEGMEALVGVMWQSCGCIYVCVFIKLAVAKLQPVTDCPVPYQ